MNDRDAGCLAFPRARKLAAPAVDDEAATVRAIFSGQDFQQCRFAGAIFAHQGADLAARDRKGDAIERDDAREDLDDTVIGQTDAHA